jgi:hypothetical protein
MIVFSFEDNDVNADEPLGSVTISEGGLTDSHLCPYGAR